MFILLLALQIFTPAPLAQRTPETLAEGHWLSCPLDDGSGDYGERALDYKIKGHSWFEVHYGPRDEFALFAGNTPEHILHTDELNLLRPAFHFGDAPMVDGARQWSLAMVGVRLIVSALPPSQPDCYSFYTSLQVDPRPRWAER